jgi:hypothetical protein
MNSASGIMYLNANTSTTVPLWIEFGPTAAIGTPYIGIYNTNYITSSTYAISNTTDYYVGVNCATSSTITLPYANTGMAFVIKDESGNAGSNPITISPSGSDKIDNDGSAILAINNGSLTFIYRNGWRII